MSPKRAVTCKSQRLPYTISSVINSALLRKSLPVWTFPRVLSVFTRRYLERADCLGDETILSRSHDPKVGTQYVQKRWGFFLHCGSAKSRNSREWTNEGKNKRKKEEKEKEQKSDSNSWVKRFNESSWIVLSCGVVCFSMIDSVRGKCFSEWQVDICLASSTDSSDLSETRD